jgi:hypothetical protein
VIKALAVQDGDTEDGREILGARNVVNPDKLALLKVN